MLAEYDFWSLSLWTKEVKQKCMHEQVSRYFNMSWNDLSGFLIIQINKRTWGKLVGQSQLERTSAWPANPIGISFSFLFFFFFFVFCFFCFVLFFFSDTRNHMLVATANWAPLEHVLDMCALWILDCKEVPWNYPDQFCTYILEIISLNTYFYPLLLVSRGFYGASSTNWQLD